MKSCEVCKELQADKINTTRIKVADKMTLTKGQHFVNFIKVFKHLLAEVNRSIHKLMNVYANNCTCPASMLNQ